MSTVEIRTELDHMLDQVDDQLLKAVYSMVSTYLQKDEDAIIGYQSDGKVVRARDFVSQAKASVSAAKEGKGITVKELEKRSTEWLKRMK